jgi:hypothetical protein
MMTLVFLLGSTADAIRIKDKTRHRTVHESINPWYIQGGIDEIIGDDDEDYHGFQLSFGRFYSGSSAVRFTFGISNHRPYYDDVRVYRHNGLLYIFDDYGQFDVTGATFSFQGMFYSSPQPQPRFYIGLGPRLGFRDANPAVFVTWYDDYNYDWAEPVYYDNGSMFSLGIEGSFGFEWFLGRQLSMFAEYGATLQNEWYILEFDYYDEYGHRIRETDWFDDGIHLDDSHIKLGLSIYF